LKIWNSVIKTAYYNPRSYLDLANSRTRVQYTASTPFIHETNSNRTENSFFLNFGRRHFLSNDMFVFMFQSFIFNFYLRNMDRKRNDMTVSAILLYLLDKNDKKMNFSVLYHLYNCLILLPISYYFSPF